MSLLRIVITGMVFWLRGWVVKSTWILGVIFTGVELISTGYTGYHFSGLGPCCSNIQWAHHITALGYAVDSRSPFPSNRVVWVTVHGFRVPVYPGPFLTVWIRVCAWVPVVPGVPLPIKHALLKFFTDSSFLTINTLATERFYFFRRHLLKFLFYTFIFFQFIDTL